MSGEIVVYGLLFLSLYFEVFLLITFFEKRPAKKTALLPNIYPSVSIIVPCFNEEKTLAATVESLLAMQYPKDKLSVLIVDDGSKDNTLAIARSFESHPQVAVITKENGGKYTALNLGIERATTELVGCLDADSFVAQDAMIEVAKKFEENAALMAVIPSMRVHAPRRPLELMQSVEYTFGIFVKKMFDSLATIYVLPGPFSIYKRAAFEKTGLFRHAHNTEDMEMAFRMHEHGLAIANAHTASVFTTVPATVRALLKQRTRWSQGFLQNSADYRHMYFNPRYGHFGMFVLPLAFISIFAALYMAGYMLFHLTASVATRIADIYATGIVPRFSLPHFDWFYFHTSMMTFLIMTILTLTLTVIILGKRIGGGEFGALSVASYFLLYGLLAPLWLGRAVAGAARGKAASWR